nr:transposase [Nodularia spumigena]
MKNQSGTKKENLTLNERVFQCENCGFECDRDLNAAINLSKIDLSRTYATIAKNLDLSNRQVAKNAKKT